MQQTFHLRHLTVARLAADRVLAHDDAPERGMTTEEPGIHGDAVLLDAIEVVGERLPVPRHTLLQCRQRDAFDPRHQARQVVDVLVAAGREREPAVPAEHGRDAVQRRRARSRVPEQLRVVVRVQVDESRRDDEAVGVDRARRGVVDIADLDDASAHDRDVGAPRRGARPVHHGAVLDEEVESHGSRSSSGTGWRKSLDAFSHVTLRMSASETSTRPSAASSCVSGHVESACG